MAERQFSGVSAEQEIASQRLYENTKRPLARLRAWWRTPSGAEYSLYILLAVAVLTIWVPFSFELTLLLLLWFQRAYLRFDRQAWDFPFRVPKTAKLKDGSDQYGKEGAGIFFIGNDQNTGMQTWVTDSDARTHWFIAGTTGSGKPQPVTSKVLTTRGWKRIRQLKVGDMLATPDGAEGKVLGIFPKGMLETFEITLDEGQCARASGDHYWLVGVHGRRAVATTAQIRAWVEAGERVVVPVGEDARRGTWVKKWVPVSSVQSIGLRKCACVLIDHPDHLYYTDDYIVTHNTEFLLGLAYNALVFNSGFIYVDGKGDVSLYDNTFRLARLLGREESLLVINFLTSGRDFFERQYDRVSNTMNPYNSGSSGMLTELSVSLMDDGGGSGDMWKGRAIAFIGGLIRVLVYLRDKGEFLLDADKIREYFELEPLERLAWDLEDTWKGGAKREKGYFARRYGAGFEKAVTPLRSFIVTIPGYVKSNIGKQEQKTLEQHGYITMQLARLFGSLADDYGHIVGTPLGEVNPNDVVINRRVLIVLLPALEKAPDSLKMLGKIIVGSIKQMAAGCLGNRLSGARREIVLARPTNSPTPFLTILDEYGYYAVLGFASMPAQARSLGFSVVFAAQDFASLKKGSAEEADQTWENTNIRGLGRSTGGREAETMKRFEGIAGTTMVAASDSYRVDTSSLFGIRYRAPDTVSVKEKSRIDWKDVASQADGEFHMFMGKKSNSAKDGDMAIVRVNSFYTGYAAVKDEREKQNLGKGLPMLDINHFGRVGPPLFVTEPEDDEGYKTMRKWIIEGKFARSLMDLRSTKSMSAVSYKVICDANAAKLEEERIGPLDEAIFALVAFPGLNERYKKSVSDIVNGHGRARPAAKTDGAGDTGAKVGAGDPPALVPTPEAVTAVPASNVADDAVPTVPAQATAAAPAEPEDAAPDAASQNPSPAPAAPVAAVPPFDPRAEIVEQVSLLTGGQVRISLDDATPELVDRLKQEFQQVMAERSAEATVDQVARTLSADVPGLADQGIAQRVAAVSAVVEPHKGEAQRQADADELMRKLGEGMSYLERPTPPVSTATDFSSVLDELEIDIAQSRAARGMSGMDM